MTKLNKIFEEYGNRMTELNRREIDARSKILNQRAKIAKCFNDKIIPVTQKTKLIIKANGHGCILDMSESVPFNMDQETGFSITLFFLPKEFGSIEKIKPKERPSIRFYTMTDCGPIYVEKNIQFPGEFSMTWLFRCEDSSLFSLDVDYVRSENVEKIIDDFIEKVFAFTIEKLI